MSKEKVLDDVARVAGGAISLLSGLSNQVREEVQSRAQEKAQNMDLVPREDFDRLEAMLIKAREKQEEYEQRISALEETLSPSKK